MDVGYNTQPLETQSLAFDLGAIAYNTAGLEADIGIVTYNAHGLVVLLPNDVPDLAELNETQGHPLGDSASRAKLS